MIVPALTFVVHAFPAPNTGAYIQHVAEFISDDAAIVAALLRGWRVHSGLIGTALGNDARGRAAARTLKQLGILGKVRLSNAISTPYEVNISDRTGHRTYFWQRDPDVLATLDSADLSLLDHARMLYVDWYDGDHILRPMQEAARLGIPVFLNVEHAHAFPHILNSYVHHATVVQASTDAAQKDDDALPVARKILDAGAQIALVTLAGGGCVAATRERIIRARAPRVEVVDGCGAGAAFAAGFIYGQVRGWSLEERVRFATAAGSFKCTRVGLNALPMRGVKKMAREAVMKCAK
jgi:sugar/nucleoside kinase (ribokinase family)